MSKSECQDQALVLLSVIRLLLGVLQSACVSSAPTSQQILQLETVRLCEEGGCVKGSFNAQSREDCAVGASLKRKDGPFINWAFCHWPTLQQRILQIRVSKCKCSDVVQLLYPAVKRYRDLTRKDHLRLPSGPQANLSIPEACAGANLVLELLLETLRPSRCVP